MAKPFNTPFQDKLKRPSALYPEEKDFKRYRRATTVSRLMTSSSCSAGAGGAPRVLLLPAEPPWGPTITPHTCCCFQQSCHHEWLGSAICPAWPVALLFIWLRTQPSHHGEWLSSASLLQICIVAPHVLQLPIGAPGAYVPHSLILLDALACCLLQQSGSEQ